MDCSPPGSPVPGIFQARALECGAIAFSENSLYPKAKHGLGAAPGFGGFKCSRRGCGAAPVRPPDASPGLSLLAGRTCLQMRVIVYVRTFRLVFLFPQTYRLLISGCAEPPSKPPSLSLLRQIWNCLRLTAAAAAAESLSRVRL